MEKKQPKTPPTTTRFLLKGHIMKYVTKARDEKLKFEKAHFYLWTYVPKEVFWGLIHN